MFFKTLEDRTLLKREMIRTKRLWVVRLCINRRIRWPKRVNHKSVSQNTNHFIKTQTNFSKHKSVYQNTKQFFKAQISLPKHKKVSQNTNLLLGTCSAIIRESLEETYFQDILRPIRRLRFCCRRLHENVLPQLWI